MITLGETVKKVLVIGGYQYGILKHLLKHDSIQSIIQIDRDTEAVQLVAESYEEFHSTFQSEKTKIIGGNEKETIKQFEDGQFDLVIADLLDMD